MLFPIRPQVRVLGVPVAEKPSRRLDYREILPEREAPVLGPRSTRGKTTKYNFDDLHESDFTDSHPEACILIL